MARTVRIEAKTHPSLADETTTRLGSRKGEVTAVFSDARLAKEGVRGNKRFRQVVNKARSRTNTLDRRYVAAATKGKRKARGSKSAQIRSSSTICMDVRNGDVRLPVCAYTADRSLLERSFLSVYRTRW